MTITSDAFGNWFIGNFVAPNIFSFSEILSMMRSALGSDDRANINNSSTLGLIEWRPDIAEETKTGVIDVPSHNYIGTFGFSSLQNASRLAIAVSDGITSSHSLFFTNGLDSRNSVSGITITSTTEIWACGNVKSFSLFFTNRSTNQFMFQSHGYLENSPLSFPDNFYSIYSCNRNTKLCLSHTVNPTLRDLHTFGEEANYPHIDLSNQPTTFEVELYLRDALSDNPYGFVPNVFKYKVDAGQTVPEIGSFIFLINNAQPGSYYHGQGNMLCIVAGRLGNTANNDLTGDFILMRIREYGI